MMSSCLLGWSYDCIASGFIVGVRARRNYPICWYHFVLLDFVLLFVLTGIFSPLLFWIFKILPILWNKNIFFRLKFCMLCKYSNTTVNKYFDSCAMNSNKTFWMQEFHKKNLSENNTLNRTHVSTADVLSMSLIIKVVSILWTHLVHCRIRLVVALSEGIYAICYVDK